MKSRKSNTPESNIKNRQNVIQRKILSPGQYENYSLDELLTFAVYCLIEEGIEATFENIVAKCFELFPAKFSLIGYPQWPDSARVNKSWLRCRTDFKYISGTVKTGFRLTSHGLRVAEKLQRNLKLSDLNLSRLQKRQIQERSREEAFINQLRNSNGFKKFLISGADPEISEYEFCDMLFCTLESPIEIRVKNLRLLQEYASRLDQKGTYEFLNLCEKKYVRFLREKKEVSSETGFRGGMHKRKILPGAKQ